MKVLSYLLMLMMTSQLSKNNDDCYVIDIKNYNAQEIIDSIKSNILLEIAFSYKTENAFFNKIIEILTIGKEIKSSLIDYTNNKEIIYTQLAAKNIQFYIYFYIENNMLIWKLYSVFDKKFIKGKSYRYQENSIALLRTIVIDIWQELFGDLITPYHSFLAYLDTSFNHHEQESCIKFCHPLLPGLEKTIFKINQNILDLASIDSKPLQSLLFSTQNNHGTAIMKLNSYGNIIPIINNHQMLISPSVNQDGLFYINSGLLYRYYYNKTKKDFCSQLLDKNADFASVYAIINNHEILVSKNKQIYKITYQINQNTNELILINAQKITENKLNSVNMTYDYIDNNIIVSQRINGYYQLVAYENTQKKILTHSHYHKQDPSISPCGNYIAYIAQTNDGERYLEVINKHTGHTIRITQTPGEYRFPVWLVR